MPTVSNNPMCVSGTPLEHYPELRLWVKREDLCCPPGPHFSKTRGVYAHIAKRPEKLIGCLDTSHSQGGWATAQACRILGKHCAIYYPETKKMRTEGYKLQPQQKIPLDELGAFLKPLQAGRSAVLYHEAKKELAKLDKFGGPGYMMPNALKLPEMITETVAEVHRTPLPPVATVIVSASSGTIAGGVWRGLWEIGFEGTLVVHQGYSRTEDTIRKYMTKMAWGERGPLDGDVALEFVDEGYAYGDKSRGNADMIAPPFPSNVFYDLKAFDWWMDEGRDLHEGEALLWNIG